MALRQLCTLVETTIEPLFHSVKEAWIILLTPQGSIQFESLGKNNTSRCHSLFHPLVLAPFKEVFLHLCHWGQQHTPTCTMFN
mmetsp:Transcript_20364/g.40324  ORF Transcript_20364/g.40324 Transcript_20364/m.40324 type:complete len:83 (-) Transcript_20364:1433-1681(-)